MAPTLSRVPGSKATQVAEKATAEKATKVMPAGDDRVILDLMRRGMEPHAESGKTEGDEAVCRVAQWTDGTFQIDFNSRPEKQTTTRSTQDLLMEALRLLDENKRTAEEG